ncbi:MAG: hypothetical protein IJJ55_06160 [Clostridia bacterium]|nr:hypothetical protein [Clostridia bacterium]
MASTDLFFTTRGDLESVADAIRQKGGTVADLTYPDGFVTAIGNISGGGGGTINNQNKSVTPTESEQSVTYDSGYTGLGTVTVGAISSTYVGSGIARRDSSDLMISGDTISAVSGYYPATASASVVPGNAGTPTATKGSVSNHSISVTPSVTNTTGYITGGTKTGTAVTVSASELVSGNKSITSNGTNIDVADYSTVTVNVSGGGVTGVAKGTLTVASNVNTSTNTKITDTSTIGFTPQAFLFYRSDRSATNYHVNYSTFVTLGSSYYVRSRTRYSSNALSTSGDTNNWTTQSSGYLYFNSDNVYFRSSSSYILAAGTWNWVAIQ